MTERDLVRTGIRGLDLILLGGIPRGNIILVEGPIGAGKTTLGIEFVVRGAAEFAEPGLIVVFESSPDKLTRDAARLGWDLAELERARRLKIVFTTREVFGQELQQADSLLLEEAAEIGARRIFVDGVSDMGGSGQDARERFHLLGEGLQRENLTAMLALEAAALGGGGFPVALHEESIADTVLRLRLEEVNRAVVRSLEVVKSRGQDFQMGRHSFRILDGRGIQVYRRVQAPRRPPLEGVAYDPATRVATGTPGLDELVNGGYFLGSTTVVAGISGAGKSVMALQFIAEGARRGERSLMLTLDEQVPQVLRNARSIGLDLETDIERGLVKVFYDPPQEIDVDQHFHMIEETVEEFQPRRVVIDSLSTYGTTLGPRGRVFRDFFHALVALMKERQIAAVYNHENPDLLGMSSMMGDFGMSSLVDNILLLNWIELGDSFRLGLTVAKMRGNPVARATNECEIVDGRGLRVLPRQLPSAARQTPFSRYYGLISRGPERRPSRRPPDADPE